jgi:riboflavin biosynthesis pyrimidine reductase
MRLIYSQARDHGGGGLAAPHAGPAQDTFPAGDLPGLYPYPPGVQNADRPWVRANMIASVDGAAALAGRSQGLAGPADQTVFGMLRALADVIVVGAATVRAEQYKPARISRRWAHLREGRPAAPPIAVITRSLDLDGAAALLTAPPEGARTIVITTRSSSPERRADAEKHADVIVAGDDRVDFREALTALAARGLRRVLTEGGPHVLGELACAALLDELCLTVSPLLAVGPAGRILAGCDGERAGLLRLVHVLEDRSYLLCRYLSAR